MGGGLKGHIAIIDDDALVLQSLADCMESAGFLVEGFGSAEGFLASGSLKDAICLIVDVQLPGITGLDLQGKLAVIGNCAPLVFVTANGTDANREQAIRHGAVGFLAKPVRRAELLNAVRKAIEP
jgi:FixJ family two-component response regulator